MQWGEALKSGLKRTDPAENGEGAAGAAMI